jgi:uncharacterized secreted repeat protein (TIGR03808 family)
MPTRRSLIAAAAAALVGGIAGLPTRATAQKGFRIAGGGLSPRGAEPVTEAFEKALAEAAKTGRPVDLEAGVYTIESLRLPAGTTIRGAPGATVIRAAGSEPPLSASRVDGIRLRDLWFEGPGGKTGNGKGAGDQALFVAETVRGLHVRDCTFARAPGLGVRLTDVGGRIETCRIEGAGRIGLFALDCDYLTVTGCVVSDCGDGGVLVWRSRIGEDGAQLRGNRIFRIRAESGGTGQNGNGINLYRAGNVIVAENTIVDCAFSAIRANSASDVQILSNQCLRSGETAIYAEFAFQGAVISGNLVDGAANGISVTNFNQGGRLASVTGNIVRNLKATGPYRTDPPGFGIGIAVEADAAITGNVVEGAPLAGLWLGFGAYLRDIVAGANVIRDTDYGIAVSVVDGAGPVVIAQNLIRNARRGAIVGFRQATPATGDLATGGAEAWRGLTITGNRVAG